MSVRTKEIRDVLLAARETPDYNIGSPRALDHLLTHVVALIEEIERIEQEQHETMRQHYINHMTTGLP